MAFYSSLEYNCTHGWHTTFFSQKFPLRLELWLLRLLLVGGVWVRFISNRNMEKTLNTIALFNTMITEYGRHKNQ